jgi:hypothetical protein
MIRGIGEHNYIDMEPYLDMETFQKLQPEIYKGFALAREFAKEGTWMEPGFTFEDMSYKVNWIPIYQAMQQFQELSDDDPIKVEGMKLWPANFNDYKQRNLFTRYLKMAMGAYDPYIYYFLWEEGDWNDRPGERDLTEEAKYFPGVVDWVLNLKTEGIFEHIGRVIFFHCEHDGLPFEHRDLDAKNGMNVAVPHRNEFIHIRPDTRNQFYLWDPENKMKYALNTRAAWWNDQDWHGGNRVMAQTYGLRIDGKFTEEFRKTLGISHLDTY